MLIRLVLFLVPVFLLLLSPAIAQDEHPVITLVKSKVKDPNKPFALTVEFRVKPGKERDFEAVFAPCLVATRKEPGCIVYYLNRDPDDPQLYIMYEQFKGVEALDYHMKQKHTRELLAGVGPLTEGEPKVKVWLLPQ